MTIKEILEEHKLTQATVSKLVGIPRNTISLWVQEQRTPPEYVVTLLSYYLDHEVGIPAKRANNENK